MADQTRQYAPTIDGIRRDHVCRYLFAAGKIPRGSRVLDLACGCGYGSWLMHGAGLEVTGADISDEAISYAKRHYQGPTYLLQKAEEASGSWDALVTFETLEHLDDPQILLGAVHAPLIIASVPNEERYPFSAEKFAGDQYPHKRHYTPDEFADLLRSVGVDEIEWYCQKDKYGDVMPGSDGLFMIAIGKRLSKR